jgi:hypothetical protein
MGFGFWFLKAALRHAHTMRCPRPEAILRPLKNFDARAIGTQIVRGQQQFEPAGSPLQLLQPSIHWRGTENCPPASRYFATKPQPRKTVIAAR